MKNRMAATLLTVLLFAVPAAALPHVGDATPSASLRDADDHVLSFSSLQGKPTLIVYEDKGSATQNQAFKDDLKRLAQGDKYQRSIALVAVADLSGYDYWPVRGFVKKAIRDESRKFGTTIYCDWGGAFRQAVGLARGRSNVVLYGKNGRVLFAREGVLSEQDRKTVIGLLRTEVGDAP
jgi:hypothetical protein